MPEEKFIEINHRFAIFTIKRQKLIQNIVFNSVNISLSAAFLRAQSVNQNT